MKRLASLIIIYRGKIYWMNIEGGIPFLEQYPTAKIIE
jgi:hypothetical protein